MPEHRSQWVHEDFAEWLKSTSARKALYFGRVLNVQKQKIDTFMALYPSNVNKDTLQPLYQALKLNTVVGKSLVENLKVP